MPRTDLIDGKISALNVMVTDLERNERVIHRIGGSTTLTLGEEIAFQTERITNLTWAKTVTDTDIESEIQRLESTLTPDELACKYGSIRGLPLEIIETIAKIEDLEIAIGTHPAVTEVTA
jgi:hypothetical protein